MKKAVVVNIYNFIRMSHVEPSIFIRDDFETVQKQMTLVRQYGFPATYALKYDALMEPRYQELIKAYAGEGDEISAWWEITGELCKKAGISFRGIWTEEHDDRVNSAYSIGYTPEERRKLVDAYMADFYGVFGFYPKTIGSWVLDTVTVSYAAEKYGILGSAICRDQMGTDGFTLWGGFPNGVYYPSRSNENIPASTCGGQLPVPMFRLLGPDPIYSFEQDVRKGLHGVYTLEPSWLIGRNPEWISWFFGCLTKEDALGVGYAHVGQENNFLWENIRPGMEPQLKKLCEMLEQPSEYGEVRVETMADTAAWYHRRYRLTPPMSFQASRDWDTDRKLSAQWYACCNYRVGFLGEEGRLRIRDFFLYRQDYPSRYLEGPMSVDGASAASNFDALPLLFPQLWIGQSGRRPFIRLLDGEDREPRGIIRYLALDELTAAAQLRDEETDELLAVFTMRPDTLMIEGDFRLCFDFLPVFRARNGREVVLEHEKFSYGFGVPEGEICRAGRDGLEIRPEQGRIVIRLGDAVSRETFFADGDFAEDARGKNFRGRGWKPMEPAGIPGRIVVPPMGPEAEPVSCVFAAGDTGIVRLSSATPGEIRYTLDGTEPSKDASLYDGPLRLTQDAILTARLFLADGRCSEPERWEYRFGIQGIRLTSGTLFDPRPVFGGNGVGDLLESKRGSLDYLDGRWRGTLQDLDIWGELPGPAFVEAVIIGFLSHHRSGIVFPESIMLYTGPDREHLSLTAEISPPCAPCAREIAKKDFSLPVGGKIGCFRLVAHRYAKMPQWCCYRGVENVFTMADNIIISPML